ncbi:protein bicaudal D-like [Amphibalanus amphitrite]|uniref:protein bicaudal D-like n=1 Tax=Amphibalanus amphitrite TaxID=1232801 RepID=UPI001C90838A|nr:protein bicaudal D-like [Amphibalanus amphitrite]
MEVAMDDVASLRAEIERLTRELDEASSDKIQSAQYGLALLEEKEALSKRCEELEAAYENSKHDLIITREALAKFQTSHEQSTRSGIEQEESMLSESHARETSLNSQILELEMDARQARQEVSRLLAEKEAAQRELHDLGKDRDLTSLERRNLRSELKDLKYRETRLLQDYSELEEENITLQKQVSALRSSQVEFESAKHEARRLLEEVDVLNGQVEEQTALKRIAEKQMEEALEALQGEREAKYALKRELDKRINSESMLNLSNLALSTLRMGEPQTESEGEDDQPALKRLEADIIDSSADKQQKPAGHVGDLFSEIHLNELRKLEKQLEQADAEKAQLTRSLRDNQESLERARADLESQRAHAAQLVAHVEALMALHEEEEGDSLPPTVGAAPPSPELAKVEQVLDKHRQRHQLAMLEISRLQTDIRDMQASECNSSEAVVTLRNEVSSLRSRLSESESKVSDLQSDLSLLSQLTALTQATLGSSQEELMGVSEELAQLYHQVCLANGQTPHRVMLEHMQNVKNLGESSPSREGSPQNSFAPTKFEQLMSSLKVAKPLKEGEAADPTQVAKQMETITDQVKYLRRAVEHAMEASKQTGTGPRAAATDGDGDGDQLQVEELQEQVIKLKSLLSTKREQIATLRTVLKANKQTAEVALANLKSKYVNEKTIVSETMMKLRNELRLLKEDAATFSSLRAMFAARCEEYVTQVDELQRQVASSEEEKKTLNSLLRMAIQQKLTLTQKLEDLELDRERRPARAGGGQDNSWRRFGGGDRGRSRGGQSRGGGRFPQAGGYGRRDP